MIRLSIAVAAVVLLGGCATTTRQTDSLLRAPPEDLPHFVQLVDVPFVEQASGYCGPATLTMAMRSQGKEVTVDELAPQIFTPGSKGSLQSDMIGASRRHGMLAIRIEGLSAVLKEVASGHPVIVFENLGLSWFPSWHYAVVTGYDIAKQDIILHSGAKAFAREDLRRFEYAWKLAGYWAIAVLPPGELAVTANELAHVSAAAGLEQAGKLAEAQRSYKSILNRWPQSFASLIGLGNVTYRNGDVASSVRYLKRATELEPSSEIARNNLQVALRAGANSDKAFRPHSQK